MTKKERSGRRIVLFGARISGILIWTVFALYLVTLPTLVGAQNYSGSSQLKPYNTRKQFLSASKSDVESRYQYYNMDPSKTFDRATRDEMRIMDNIQTNPRYKNNTKVRWIKGHGSCAHPDAGIGINKEQLYDFAQKVNEEYGKNNVNYKLNRIDCKTVVYQFVLAHERSHMIQFNIWGRGKSRLYPTRVSEAQADILAGMTLLDRHAMDDPNTSMLVSGMLVLLSNDLGTPTASWKDHPTPQQRMESVVFGWTTTAQFRTLILQGVPEPEAKRRCGFRTNEKDFFDYSLRKAYELTGIPEGSTGE